MLRALGDAIAAQPVPGGLVHFSPTLKLHSLAAEANTMPALPPSLTPNSRLISRGVLNSFNESHSSSPIIGVCETVVECTGK